MNPNAERAIRSALGDGSNEYTGELPAATVDAVLRYYRACTRAMVIPSLADVLVLVETTGAYEAVQGPAEPATKSESKKKAG